MTTWHTAESAYEEWGDAVSIADEAVLDELLEIAKEQVMAYAFKRDQEAYEAATEEEPYDVPARLRRAQLRQAENMWNAARVDPSGEVGEGSFVSSPHPLDWHIKQLIRPRRAVPYVR